MEQDALIQEEIWTRSEKLSFVNRVLVAGVLVLLFSLGFIYLSISLYTGYSNGINCCFIVVAFVLFVYSIMM